MKFFKFKFTKLTLAFIYIGLALSAVAFGVNTYFVIADGIKTAANPVYPILQYTLMYFVCVLLFVILLSLLISSYYSIDGEKLKTSFGILDRATNKLSLYFDSNTFMVIVVKPEWYEDFTDALLKVNPKIEFSIKSKENDKKDEDKNK